MMGLDVKGKRNFTFRVLKKGGKGCTRMFCVEIYREHLSRKCTKATYDTFLDDFPKNMPPFWGKHPTLRTKTSCLRHHQNISSFGMSQPTSKMFWFSVFVKCFLFWCLFGHMNVQLVQHRYCVQHMKNSLFPGRINRSIILRKSTA